MDAQLTLLAFLGMSLFAYAFTFWRNAKAEGFLDDQIFDAFFATLIGAVIGGKLLFRPLSLNYFQYELVRSPLTLEGALVGGGLLLYLVIKKYHWSTWKIGDVIAPALTLFQTILFFGIWLVIRNPVVLGVSGLFAVLSVFIWFLKNKKHLGTSVRFFELKRLNRLQFSGGLFAVYLTGSSVIAMLFLFTNLDTRSGFWWFQVVFYSVVFFSSVWLFRRKLHSQKITMTSLTKFAQPISDAVTQLLHKRQKQLEKEHKKLDAKDPFMQEAKAEGFRNVDELGDEVADIQEHTTVTALKENLDQEAEEIKKSLQAIEKGTYGICQSCGKKIESKRLEIYPTATLCAACQKKADAKK